jgi:hypothetical protein
MTSTLLSIVDRQPRSYMGFKVPVCVAPCYLHRVPPRLDPYMGSRFENSFSEGLFVKNILKKV